jgi:hypothetical protein
MRICLDIMVVVLMTTKTSSMTTTIMSSPKKLFDEELKKLRDALPEDQKQQFSLSSLEAVKTEIQLIQARFGSEKKLRNLNRLTVFLDIMKQIEELAQIFLNVSEIVAFVWVSL